MSKWQDGYDTGYSDGKMGLPKHIPSHIPKDLAKLYERLGAAEAKQFIAKEMLASIRTRRQELHEKYPEKCDDCKIGMENMRSYWGTRHTEATTLIVELTQKIRAIEGQE